MERRSHRQGDTQDHFQDGCLPLFILRGRAKAKDKTQDHFVKLGCASEGDVDLGRSRGRGSPSETDLLLLGVTRGRRHFNPSHSSDGSSREAFPGAGNSGHFLGTGVIAPGGKKVGQGLHTDCLAMDRGKKRFGREESCQNTVLSQDDTGSGDPLRSARSRSPTPVPAGVTPRNDRGRSRGHHWLWRSDDPHTDAASLAVVGVHSPQQKDGSRRLHSINRGPSEMWMRWKGSDLSAEPQVDRLPSEQAAGLEAKAALAARRGSANRYDLRKPQDGCISWWGVSEKTPVARGCMASGYRAARA